MDICKVPSTEGLVQLSEVGISQEVPKFSYPIDAPEEIQQVYDEAILARAIEEENIGLLESVPMLNIEDLLNIAIQKGKLRILNWLVEKKNVDLNGKDSNGDTPLHVAICYRVYDVLDWLVVEKKVDFNIQNQLGNTALHTAIDIGIPEVVDYLVANGADLSIQNRAGCAPGNFAVELGRPWSGPIDLNSEKMLKEKVLAHMNSNLAEGAYSGGLAITMRRKIVETLDSFSSTFPDKENLAPIIEAFKDLLSYESSEKTANSIRTGNLTIIPILWNSELGSHALTLVFHKGKLVVCNKGEAAPGQNENIVIFDIDETKCSEELLEEIESHFGSSIDIAGDFYYNTLPQERLRRSDPSVEEFPPVTVQASKGGACTMGSVKAALKVAFYACFTTVEEGDKNYKEWSTWARIEFLTDYLEFTSKHNLSINTQIVAESFTNLLKRLFLHEEGIEREVFISSIKAIVTKHPVILGMKSDLNRSPLHLAARGGALELIDFFIDCGSDPNEKDRNGYTPLHLAAERGKEGVMQALMDRGSDKTLKNKGGSTPLDVATVMGRTECMRILA